MIILTFILPGFSISVNTEDSPGRVKNEISDDNVTSVKVIDEEVGWFILFCHNNMVNPIQTSTIVLFNMLH